MEIVQTHPLVSGMTGMGMTGTTAASGSHPISLNSLNPFLSSSAAGAGIVDDWNSSSVQSAARSFNRSLDLGEQTSLIPQRPLTHAHRSDESKLTHRNQPGKDELTGLMTTDAFDDASRRPDTTRQTGGTAYPGRPLRYLPGQPLRFDTAARQWQARMQARGWSIEVDGLYGASSAKICRQFQQEKGLQVDGIVGPATWAATFRTDNVTQPQPGSSVSSTINAKGLALIKQFEGLVLQAYRDPVGVWTIGYGHTGPDVKPGAVITRSQAEALLKKDLARFESAVRSLVKVPVNANQFSALVSFAFNVGSGALAQSTLLARLNQRDYQGAANQFGRWVYGDGQVLPGLVRRREAEKALFLTPV